MRQPPAHAATDPRAGTDQKLLGLEALRFTCAMAVLVWHYQHFTYVGPLPGPDFIRAQQPFYDVLAFFYVYGALAVPVFWTISGFVFSWKYATVVSDAKITGRQFFILRFSRLYPLHIATLLAVALLQAAWLHRNGFFFVYADNSLPTFGLQLFMASNWVERPYSFNGPIWSVSAEVLIYALFFTAFRSLRRPVLVCIAFIIFGLAVQRLHLGWRTADCALFFFMGVLTAQLSAMPWVRRKMGLLTGFAITLVLLLVTFTKYKEFTAITLGIPLAVHLSANVLRLPGRLRGVVESAANLTYAIYLTHFPIQLMMMTLMQVTGSQLNYREPTLFLVFILTTLGASTLTFRFFEMPVQAWLRQRLSGPRRLAQAVG